MRMTSIRTWKPTWRKLQMPHVNTHNIQEEIHLIDIEQKQKVLVERHLVRLKYNFSDYCYGADGVQPISGRNKITGQICIHPCFRGRHQGPVVQKPVNVNPGLVEILWPKL